ncbi:MAG: TIGR03364 family FAD-dependent oxidoreductase [Planctomycetota bacterium]
MEKYDVAIVGGGIIGLAQAWRAASRGLQVALFERDSRASGASIRNFGMIWPIGQNAGEPYETACESAALWRELGEQNVLQVEECGALHLAHREDELAVLQEFVGLQTHQCEMLSAEETCRRSQLANPSGLLGAMWSPTELRADPRIASANIAAWLHSRYSVQFSFGTPVTHVESGNLHCSGGQRVLADRIVICSGSDLRTLYPKVLDQSGLKLCKLQMLKAKVSAAKASAEEPAPHLASGLTLRHYTSFQGCQALETLKQRVAAESPELDEYGIHVMASQFPSGDVILGDSHEYGADIAPFDKSEIDDYMIRELRGLIQLEDWTITQRWHGIYAKHSEKTIFQAEPDPGVFVFVGPGGAGMTMSFGLAERAWKQWD